MNEIWYSDGSVHQGESLTPDSLPDLGVVGIDLTYFRVNYQVRLQFDDVEIVIATPFTLDDNGEVQQFDPEHPSALGPLLGLFPSSLDAAVVDTDLTLRLSFQGGPSLAVPQHPYYEAWQVHGPGSRLIVCPPAGDGTLAVWR